MGQVAVLTLFVTLATAYAGVIFTRIRRLDLGVYFGVDLGLSYFVLVPMGLVVTYGYLPAPEKGYIPAVSLEGDATALLVLQAMLCIYLGWDVLQLLIGRSSQPTADSRMNSSRWLRVEYAALIAVSLMIIQFVASGLIFGGNWAEAVKEYRSEGGVGFFIAPLMTGFKIAVLAASAALVVQGKRSIRWAITMVAILAAIHLFTTGNRIFALQAVLILVALLITMRKYRALLIAGCFAVPFGYVMTLYSTIRAFMHQGSGSGLSRIADGLERGWAAARDAYSATGFGVFEYLYGITEAVNFNVLVGIIHDFPARHGYLLGSTLVKLIALPVPRSIWESKPPSITIVAARHFAPAEKGLSLGTTIIGELYANFGAAGILLLPILVIATGFLVRRLAGDSTRATFLGLVIGFTMVRMAFSDVILFALFAGCAMFFVRREADHLGNLGLTK